MTIYQPGDLLFFWGTDLLSTLIRCVTGGPSHVGMVVRFDPEGTLLVEATTMLATPCLVKHQHAGVQANDIDARIKQYTRAGGRVEVWRLAPKWRLSRCQQNELSANAYNDYLGKPYDVRQAAGSATALVKFLVKRWLGWLGIGFEDRTQFYCSETNICQLQDLKIFLRDTTRWGRWFDVNPSDYSPAEFRRSIRALGLYQREAVFQ